MGRRRVKMLITIIEPDISIEANLTSELRLGILNW
jgi:hypothetical protein